MRVLAALLVMFFAMPALAQQSSSFKLEEQVFNAGGRPSDGIVMTSGSFKVTLDALGEAVVGFGMTSSSYRLEVGFVAPYLPPGETAGACIGTGESCLHFVDKTTMSWPPEKSSMSYDLYRDEMAAGYGSCEQEGVPGTTTTDASTPSVGDGYYYVVTAKNRLQEEGTKGFQSDGTERLGAFELSACP